MKSLNTVVRALKEGEALKRHEGVSHLRQDRQGRLHEGVGTGEPEGGKEPGGRGGQWCLRGDQSD